MKTRHVTLAILASLAILVSACSAAIGGPSQTTVAVSDSEFSQAKNISKQITISAGSELTVRLASNPTTGFSWTDPGLATPGILTQSDNKYVAPVDGVVGAGGTQVWVFKSLAKGTTTVKSDYSRPWEGGEKSERTFLLTVTVE